MAFAFVVGAVGLSVVPTVAAVSPDCDDDFEIPVAEPNDARRLSGSATEVGLIDVTSAQGDTTVHVSLESNEDDLEFGIFELNGSCVRSDDVNTSVCQSDVRLETIGLLDTPPESQACELDAPASGTTTFYFVMENQQSDPLDYKIWEEP